MSITADKKIGLLVWHQPGKLGTNNRAFCVHSPVIIWHHGTFPNGGSDDDNVTTVGSLMALVSSVYKIGILEVPFVSAYCVWVYLTGILPIPHSVPSRAAISLLEMREQWLSEAARSPRSHWQWMAELCPLQAWVAPKPLHHTAWLHCSLCTSAAELFIFCFALWFLMSLSIILTRWSKPLKAETASFSPAFQAALSEVNWIEWLGPRTLRGH